MEPTQVDLDSVLIFNDRPDMAGGAERQVAFEKELLEQHGVTVDVIGFSTDDKKPGTIADEIIETGFSTPHEIMSRAFFSNNVRKRIADLVAEIDPDLIHFHKCQRYPASVLLACKDYPSIKTHHDFTTVCPSGWGVYADTYEPCPCGPGVKCVRHDCRPVTEMVGFYLPYYSVKMRLERKLIDQHIAPSNALTSVLQDFRYETVTLNNPTVFKPAKKPITPSKYNQLLYVGRISEAKGVRQLVEAVQGWDNIPEDFALVLAGDGPIREELQQTVTANDSIRFYGYANDAELKDLYKSSRGLVIPSLSRDNFPTVVIEAMSHGCPVIGSNRGGIPELVADSKRGKTFDPTNNAELRNAITYFYENGDEIDNYATRCLRFVKEQLSPESFFRTLHGEMSKVQQS